jgi:hypothetical protein
MSRLVAVSAEFFALRDRDMPAGFWKFIERHAARKPVSVSVTRVNHSTR